MVLLRMTGSVSGPSEDDRLSVLVLLRITGSVVLLRMTGSSVWSF